jgi:hypothetical protein
MKKDYLVLFIIALFFIFKAGEIPAGLFCDEAEIGNIALQLLKGNASAHFIPPFFYEHFNYVLGYLHIALTAPFVAFGLGEFTVRFASIFYALTAIFIVYLVLKELGVKKLFPLLLFAFTPLFFHVSRINFGHTSSFLFITLGLFFYVKFKKTKKLAYVIGSGLSFGISCYGYGGFILGTPVLILSLLIGEIIHNRFRLHKYKGIVMLCAMFFIAYLPILYQLAYNPFFSNRLREKNTGGKILQIEKIPVFFRNYPKYYSYEYLFLKGEAYPQKPFITRHSIIGNGLYLQIYLFILLIGFLSLVLIKDKQKHFFTPFFVLYFLAPIPDLVTTKDTSLPYSFSLYYALIGVPFVTAYALKGIDLIPKSIISKKLVSFFYFIFGVILVIQIALFLANYYKYPQYSADFWGWQYGPKEIIHFFVSEKDNYDEFYMSRYFNEPSSLISFYNKDNKCRNCFVGGLERVDLNKKQLFALRVEEMTTVNPDYYSLKKVIYLHNNEAGYYIIEPRRY